MTDIAHSSTALIPEASAKISLRIVPGSEPKKKLDAPVAHLESHAPWGARVEVHRTKELRRCCAAPTDVVKGNSAGR
jgi:acetylornithine deacetylase/succinyl-diaminopimelate desuccinylase-like protein